MIKQVEKTKDNILRIAAEYGKGETDFMFLLKQNNLVGPFDPLKWNKYIEAITHLPPCPLCNGDQKLYDKHAGRFGSPRGLGCREYSLHFYIMTIGMRLVRNEWPDFTYEQAVEWIKNNWKETVLDAHGDICLKEECAEVNGKYYRRQEAERLSAGNGSMCAII